MRFLDRIFGKADRPVTPPINSAPAPAPAQKPYLAILDPTELQIINEARSAIATHDAQRSLMVRGLQGIWKELAVKYSLPPEFVPDYQTGHVYDTKETPA